MRAASRSTAEAFQPIPVRARSDAPIRYALRCVLDLQLLTIHRFLRTHLAGLRGRLLDVGAGECPWRDLLTGVDYVGIDVEAADDFGMRRHADVVYYDGRRIPFPDASFDHVLCVEVLEHVEDPRAFVQEIARVLKPLGSLILTVPWSARLHHLPHDYHRFSGRALESLFATSGFDAIRIEARGNVVAVIANKLLVLVVALCSGRKPVQALWRWPAALLLSPVAAAFIAAAHVAVRFRGDETDDPLGYGLVARRA